MLAVQRARDRAVGPSGSATAHELARRSPEPSRAAAGLVASGSFDGTVTLKDTPRGTLLRTLRPDRRLDRLDITRLRVGLRGITALCYSSQYDNARALLSLRASSAA